MVKGGLNIQMQRNGICCLYADIKVLTNYEGFRIRVKRLILDKMS